MKVLPTIWSKWNPDICDRNTYLNFREEINLKDCNIVKRIGSESADAEVYHIIHNNIGFALKLMPRIDSDSEQKNKTEIEIATRTNNSLKYFPKTFGFGTTNNFMKEKNSLLFKKAKKYSCYLSILDQLKTKRQKLEFTQLFKEGISYKDLMKKFNIEKCDKKPIIDYLISELANGDLGNYIMANNISLYDWKIILFDIITGIYSMAKNLKKAHTDLHFGNILIILPTVNCNVTALLHDFGRTINIDDNLETYLTGLISFCKEFIEASKRTDLNIPQEIKKVIIQINENIEILLKSKLSLEKIYGIYKYSLITIKNIDDNKEILKKKSKRRGRSKRRSSKTIRNRKKSKIKKRSYSK